jgi:hypothetical protein
MPVEVEVDQRRDQPHKVVTVEAVMQARPQDTAAVTMETMVLLIEAVAQVAQVQAMQQ